MAEYRIWSSSAKRVLQAAYLQEPDSVPVGPYMGNHGAKVAGVKISEYCTDARVMAEAQLKAWDIYGQDIIPVQSDNYYIAEGFGVKVEMHEDSTPTLKKPVIEDLKDIYGLKVPEPYRDGRMAVYLEATKRVKEQVGALAAVRGTGTGPFALAGHLMGTERFLMELAMADMDPEGEEAAALRHLLDLTSDALIEFAKALLKEGADIVQAGDSLASIDVISPKMYRKWAFPYEKKFFKAINRELRDKNAAAILHVCGNMTPVLNEMAETGANILELDYKVNIAEAKQRVGGKVCLMGNLNPSALLLMGTPEAVDAEARKCIKDAAGGGGFILGSGCEVAYFTPKENIRAMINVARQSSYPV